MYFPYRKSPRMPGLDYNQTGRFFITFSTFQGEETLGTIDPHTSEMTLSSRGQIVLEAIHFLSDGHLGVTIDHFVIMPNHCHLLVSIRKRADFSSLANAMIPRFVSTLKRVSNHKCGYNLWHRSYHDHFVRDPDDLQRISDYIDHNPARWAEDKYHPSRLPQQP